MLKHVLDLRFLCRCLAEIMCLDEFAERRETKVLLFMLVCFLFLLLPSFIIIKYSILHSLVAVMPFTFLLSWLPVHSSTLIFSRRYDA